MLDISTATAILYTGNHAQRCISCNRFRYPHCHLDDKPYCQDCSTQYRLRPISPLETIKPKLKKRKRCNKIRPQNSLRLSILERIVVYLGKVPYATNKEIARYVQTSITYTIKIVRNCDRIEKFFNDGKYYYRLNK